jgi:hypothetical protein
MPDFGIFRGFNEKLFGDKLYAGQLPINLGMVRADFFQGLLDLYPNAAAAYSLRKLRDAYTGSAIEVRRASDNATQNIGFVNSELDTSTLTTFCSGTNGFVTTWYDQSGNANNATQTTATNQSQIVSSGSVISEGGKPCLQYNNDLYSSTYELTDDIDFLALIVIRINSVQISHPRYAAFNSSINGVNVQIGYNSDTNEYYTRKDNRTDLTTNAFSTTGSRNLIAHGCQSNTNYFSRNGSLDTFTNTGAPTANSALGDGLFLLKGFNTSAAYVNTGNIQEFILYPSDKLSDLSGIETNINDFYSIY